jgi:hypothetical protein
MLTAVAEGVQVMAWHSNGNRIGFCYVTALELLDSQLIHAALAVTVAILTRLFLFVPLPFTCCTS